MSEPAREQSPKPTSPYPGLRPFRQDEAKLFFGRDAQIDDVLARLKRHQFLGVVGSSGCGKSSLIRAGALPALEGGLMGELGSSWFIADMKPGDAPLTNLAQGLMKSGVLGVRWSNTPEGIALLTATLRRSDVSLVNLIQQVNLPKYTNLLVLADQFEEVFRFQQSDPNEALAFVNLLLATGRDRSASIYVVLTMRSDYLGPCALFPGLPEALNDAQYLCPRLTRDQLAEAIEGPASLFGGEVERALVTQIVNDAGANSDQLPLVQHVLARMWHARPQDGRGPSPEPAQIVLRLKDYQDRGGLNGCSTSSLVTPDTSEGVERSSNRYGIGPGYSYRQNALSEHADEAYLSLGDSSHESRSGGPDHKPSPKQRISQMLFRCLAERGPSGQYVRRPMKVRDVAAIAGCSVAEIIEVVEVFRREDRSFLVPPVGVALDAQSVLDISHEALIRQWHRFGGQSDQPNEADSSQSWLALEDQSRRRYRRLAEAAENEKVAGLLRNPELGFLNQWWEAIRLTRSWTNACVAASYDRTISFLKRSLAEAAEEERERQAEQQGKIALAEEFAQKMKRRSVVIAIVAVLAIVGLITAVQASREAALRRNDAIKQRKLADEKTIEARKERDKANDEKFKAATQAERAREQTEVAEATLARSNYFLAHARWNENRIAEAQKLLRSVPVDYQNFEWHYSRREFDSDMTLEGHKGAVTSVSFSPDGKRIVSGSEDKTLKVWNAENGREIFTLTGHSGPVRSVCFSPDGKRIVSGSDGVTNAEGLTNTLKVWDADSGEELRTLSEHSQGVLSVSFSPDGKRIVSGSSDTTIKVWDAESYLELKSRFSGNLSVYCVAYSEDGKWIVCGCHSQAVLVWDADLDQEPIVLKGHTGQVRCVSFSPDGKRIVSGGSFSPFAVSDEFSGGSEAVLKLWDWDVKRGQEKLELPAHTGCVTSVNFSPVGTRMVSGGGDKLIKLWDAARKKTSVLKAHTGTVLSVSFSNDGKHIVSGSRDRTVKIWNTNRSSETLALEAVPRDVHFGSDGKQIVTGNAGSEVKVWDAVTGQEKTLGMHTDYVTSVTFRSDAKRIVSGSLDTTLIVWDAASGQKLHILEKHTGPVTCIRLSPDGKRIISGSRDETLIVWDAESGQKLHTLKEHTDAVTCVAFSPVDAKWIVSGSDDKTLKIWDVQRGQNLLTLEGHTGQVKSVCFSPDGKLIVSGSGTSFDDGKIVTKDNTLKVWDVGSGQLLRTLNGHTGPVTSVCFSPDGKRVVSGSGTLFQFGATVDSDNTLKVWDPTSGQELLTLKGHSGAVTSLQFSPDGRLIITGSERDRTLKVWDGTPLPWTERGVEHNQSSTVSTKPAVEVSPLPDHTPLPIPARTVDGDSASSLVRHGTARLPVAASEVLGFSLAMLLSVGLIAMITLTARR